MVRANQINVRRLVGAIALFGVMLRFLQLCVQAGRDESSRSPYLATIYIIAAFVAGGAAAGCLEGRPIRGALIALGISAAIAIGVFAHSFLLFALALVAFGYIAGYSEGRPLVGAGAALYIVLFVFSLKFVNSRDQALAVLCFGAAAPVVILCRRFWRSRSSEPGPDERPSA